MSAKFPSRAFAGSLVIFGFLLTDVPAQAHSNDWATPFMGGMMAGRVLSNLQEQRERQTQAMQEMAQGGGGFRGYGGGYGAGYGGYGGGYGRPSYGPPPQYGPPPECR